MPEIKYIEPSIRNLAVPIEQVQPDPANARVHSVRNIDVIRASLAGFKQQTPIVIDADGVCRKGNATLEAAKLLGWDHIAAVRTTLKLDWCSYKAARFAVENWHYSRSMPASRTVKVGVWEDGVFKGAVIFSWGANQYLGREFGLKMSECCELTRVALDVHATPVTRIIRIAISMLKQQSPGLRLIISYADCDQDHHGGIYAGGNWVYVGKVQLNGGTPKYRIFGNVIHGRSVAGRGWKQNIDWIRKHVDASAEKVYTLGKHKYLMPLDHEVRQRLAGLARPYPKRAGSTHGETPGVQPGEGGSIPTPALCEAQHDG